MTAPAARTAEVPWPADPAAPAPAGPPADVRAVADAAKGFLPDDEARALYDAAWAVAAHGPMLEVGSYCGKSACWLGAAAAAHGGRVVTVDHHRGSEENQPGWDHHDPEVVDPRTGRIDTLPFLRRTLIDAGLDDVVVPVVGRSPDVAALWGTALALLFVDGGHTEAHAAADYAGWAPWVAPGGVLAVHDVFPDPSDGGQAPYHLYRRALGDGFVEVRAVGSLRVLRRPHPAGTAAPLAGDLPRLGQALAAEEPAGGRRA